QVLVPVGEDVEELVEAEEDRCDREDRSQQRERLEGRVPQLAGVIGAHGWLPDLREDSLYVREELVLPSRRLSFRGGGPVRWAERDAAGIGALADPVRRRLYLYVCSRPESVGRDEAGAAVGVARPPA